MVLFNMLNVVVVILLLWWLSDKTLSSLDTDLYDCPFHLCPEWIRVIFDRLLVLVRKHSIEVLDGSFPVWHQSVLETPQCEPVCSWKFPWVHVVCLPMEDWKESWCKLSEQWLLSAEWSWTQMYLNWISVDPNVCYWEQVECPSDNYPPECPWNGRCLR